ncbi:MAG: glycosyltransferase [Patescibacteria group bacterium]|nr:glycosyltransferase [Actinomycetota bacterium]MCL5438540.1 glycosyltransferase [Patescibacteria group bacterium]
MKYNESLVSVILPVYNASPYLVPCLESLLNQVYKDIEIIAIDDFSRDDSYKILKEFKKMDARVRVYKNVKRYGVVVTMNRCLRRAKGKYIAFCRPKDINYLNRIKKQVTFLETNQKTVAVGTQCTFINEKGRTFGKSDFPIQSEIVCQKLLTGQSTQFETVMINRSILPKDILKFNLNFYPLIFVELFMKLVKFGNFENIPEYLYYHRKSEDNYFQTLKKYPSYIKLWIKSALVYDYKPPISSLLSPLTNY